MNGVVSGYSIRYVRMMLDKIELDCDPSLVDKNLSMDFIKDTILDVWKQCKKQDVLLDIEILKTRWSAFMSFEKEKDMKDYVKDAVWHIFVDNSCEHVVRIESSLNFITPDILSWFNYATQEVQRWYPNLNVIFCNDCPLSIVLCPLED